MPEFELEPASKYSKSFLKQSFHFPVSKTGSVGVLNQVNVAVQVKVVSAGYVTKPIFNIEKISGLSYNNSSIVNYESRCGSKVFSYLKRLAKCHRIRLI